MAHGEKPTLQVLDDILPPKGSYSEVYLGMQQILMWKREINALTIFIFEGEEF